MAEPCPQIKTLLAIIIGLTKGLFYGSVTIRFEKGVPTFIEKVEKIKLG